MAAYGGMRCIKYLLFLFNFFFVIIGAILIGVGVSTKTGWIEKYFAFVHISEYSAPPNLLIAVGCLIFLIAFLGCWGAMKENQCMILTYSILVGLILVLELGAAFAAFALRDDLSQELTKNLKGSLGSYGKNSSELDIEITRSWNIMQAGLHCCGVEGFTDWKNYTATIPETCCIEDISGCSSTINYDTPNPVAEQHIYIKGCLQKAIDDFAVGTIGIIGLVLAAIELIGVVCACCLVRSIRYSYETV